MLGRHTSCAHPLGNTSKTRSYHMDSGHKDATRGVSPSTMRIMRVLMLPTRDAKVSYEAGVPKNLFCCRNTMMKRIDDDV